MEDELIARMRDRVRRARRVIEMARDPEMIKLLEQVVRDIETDIKRLERSALNPDESSSLDRSGSPPGVDPPKARI